MVDTLGVYNNTPAEMTIGFSGPGSYSFTFGFVAVAAPEPGIYGAFAAALTLLPLGAGMLRMLRRRQAA